MSIQAQSLEELRARTSVKWRTHPTDVLPLFVAELDFPLAEPIARALHESISRSDTGYTSGDAELPEAFSAFAMRRWGWSVHPDHVRTTADVSMGIVECLRRVTQPGDGVVITPPVYPPFYDLVPESGAVVVEVPLRERAPTEDADVAGLGTSDLGWALDLDGIDAAFEAGARAMVLCNPHNPLGHPHPLRELEQLAAIAERHGATIISDEIHGPLTHTDGRYVPFLTVSDAAREHGIALTSASKAFNVAGLKCAQIVTGSARMQVTVESMYQEVFWRTGHLGVQAGIAAYRHGDAWLDGVIATLEANRRLLGELLAAKLPGVVYRQPTASYLAWLDMRGLGLGEDPAAELLSTARVALSPGVDFGTQGTGFARLNFGCSPEVLIEAVDRIAAATIGSHDLH